MTPLLMILGYAAIAFCVTVWSASRDSYIRYEGMMVWHVLIGAIWPVALPFIVWQALAYAVAARIQKAANK